MSDLAGQVAVVTGGGRGVGEGIVEALAARGMGVAVVGRSSAEIEAVAAGASFSIHGDNNAEPASTVEVLRNCRRFRPERL